MRNILLADSTLRRAGNDLSFREKVEVVRLLDGLQLPIIELPPLKTEADAVLVRTAFGIVKTSVLSVPITVSDDIAAVKGVLIDPARARLSLSVPVTPARMEYCYHLKPKQLTEAVAAAVTAARAVCPSVELIAEDAAGDPAALRTVVEAAVAAGATAITLSDEEGKVLPEEAGALLAELRAAFADTAVSFGFAGSDAYGMGIATTLAALRAGADEVKAMACGGDYPALDTVASLLSARASAFDLSLSVKGTELRRSVAGVCRLLGKGACGAAPSAPKTDEAAVLSEETDEATLTAEIRRLGYDLTPEDLGNVYEEFRRIASKKTVNERELESIIATSAVQVPPTYRLVSYVINTGNIITSTAHIVLEHNGERAEGICLGDGPIDASFLALESIVGHHYELDDFRIQAVTQGREAMGSALVRLRAGGQLYAGEGISTDILGASIRAYLNALNKIVYEEAGR